MPYTLVTPWLNQTWIESGEEQSPYARIAGRRITGGTRTGTIPVNITDVPRGITLIVNGTTVTESRTPSQDALAAATAYYLGGHTYTLSDAEAQVLIDAGYSSYLTPIA